LPEGNPFDFSLRSRFAGDRPKAEENKEAANRGGPKGEESPKEKSIILQSNVYAIAATAIRLQRRRRIAGTSNGFCRKVD
jgi:hypothetical protein